MDTDEGLQKIGESVDQEESRRTLYFKMLVVCINGVLREGLFNKLEYSTKGDCS